MIWADCNADAGRGVSVPPVSEPDGGGIARVLTASEAKSVETALTALTYVAVPDCYGIDGEDWYLTTFDAAGHAQRTYVDRDINCVMLPQSQGILDLYALLAKLGG